MLFDAGRRHAITAEARAAYDAQVANYRQTVLQSFQDVEDQLRRIQHPESRSGGAATNRRRCGAFAADLHHQYKGGLTTYLQVITAQTIALTNQRTAADITTRQFAASVQLVKALGGSWDRTQLPHP